MALYAAIALDPRFALAHCGLAEYCWIEAFYAAVLPKNPLIKGKAAAEAALRLDDSLAEAHAMRGIFRAYLDLDWQGAEDAFIGLWRLIPGRPSCTTDSDPACCLCSDDLKRPYPSLERP